MMISIFCILMCLFVSNDATAQYKFFTGGTLAFDTEGNSNSDAKNLEYLVAPYIGYSVSEKIIIGLSVGYAGTRTEVTNDNYTNNGELQLTPFMRYRKGVGERMGLYGELGVSLGLGNVKTVATGVDDITSNTTSFRVYIGPGIDYALADRWVINAGWGALSYKGTSIKDVDGSDSDLDLIIDPANIRFSLNYLF